MTAQGRSLYVDTESNGLLKASPATHYKDGRVRKAAINRMDRFWCLGAIDLETDEEFYFGVDQPEGSGRTIEDGIKFFEAARLVVAHNGIDFDYRALDEFGPWKRPPECHDSMVAAKMVWPYDALEVPDRKLMARGKLDGSLLKRHSLKAWGQRLGLHKGDYTHGFEAFHPEMPPYMMQDCRVGVKLWRLTCARLGWDPVTAQPLPLVDGKLPPGCDHQVPRLALDIEEGCAAIIAEQETFGVRFDVGAARRLSGELLDAMQALEVSLRATFGAWWENLGERTVKRTTNTKMKGYPDVIRPRYGKNGQRLRDYVGPPEELRLEGSTYSDIEWTEFSPSNRHHLARRLQEVFGWQPAEFSEDGVAKVDEATLAAIPPHIVPAEVITSCIDYFVLSKMYGMLTKGSKAWLSLVEDDGRIYGTMDPNGAVTQRALHRDPNLGQVPSVKKGKDDKPLKGREGKFGLECRALFLADERWEITGVDASSLELIDLGHELYPYDGGKLSERVCDPKRDPHTEHAAITKLPRADTKTVTYLYVYGGSAWKLTREISITEEEVPKYLSYRGLPALLNSVEKRFTKDYVDRMDPTSKALLAKAQTIIKAFEKAIDGIVQLSTDVKQEAAKGWLVGMDGRKLFVRKPWAALNTKLQSAGAITCKLWMVLTHRYLREAGLVHGRDYKQVLWVHDELQFTHRPEHRDLIRETALKALYDAGVMLGLRGHYRGEAKTGKTWADTH